MKKRKFLADLEALLEEKEVQVAEIERVLNDYESMIDDALRDGQNEEDFIKSLGKINDIFKGLNKMYKEKNLRKGNILVSLSPFIALFSFFMIGYFFDAWHPGWLVFLIIPIIAIITESRSSKRFVGLFPIVYTVFFILVGTYGNREFIIDANIINNDQISVSLPLLWHPLWAGYLYTLAIDEVLERKLYKRVIGLIDFGLITAYITIELIFGFQLWHLLFIVALILISIPVGLFNLVLKLKVNLDGDRNQILAILGVSLLSTIIFLVLGFLTNAWVIAWLIFLIIPVFAIGYDQFINKEPTEIVSYTPFIATFLFFTTGYFFNIFQISWLFFLLIPVTAIIEEQYTKSK